jgi:hypothetical protein
MAAVNTNPPVLTEQQIVRFWNYVDKTPGHGPKGECWKWTRGTKSGYGFLEIQRNSKVRKLSAHRVAFFLANGRWPTLFVCHICDWPLCCYPAHLFEATNSENQHDKVRKGRQARGERGSHAKLSAAQVLEIRSLCRKGLRNRQAIAQRFGVTSATIASIVRRANWKHI